MTGFWQLYENASKCEKVHTIKGDENLLYRYKENT